MNTYFCLLRGINVSGHNIIKMAELRKMFADIGYFDVITYIQSGNIIFNTTSDKLGNIEAKIKQAIAERFSLDIELLCKTKADLEAIVSRNPFAGKELQVEENIYFAILGQKPSTEIFDKLSDINNDEEEIIVLEDTVYSYYKKRLPKTVMTNSFILKYFKKRATIRNIKTMNKLVELGRQMSDKIITN